MGGDSGRGHSAYGGGTMGGGLTHTWGGTTNIKHQTKLHAKPYCGYHIGKILMIFFSGKWQKIINFGPKAVFQV